MKYLQKSFSVGFGDSASYRNNYDDIFGKKSDKLDNKFAEIETDPAVIKQIMDIPDTGTVNTNPYIHLRRTIL